MRTSTWLMVGMSPAKRRERRQRWWDEVVCPGGSRDAMIERAREVIELELEEDFHDSIK